MKQKTYINFIIRKSAKICKMIDEGKSYKYIETKLSKDHSINTHHWAYNYAFSIAKNKKNMKKVLKDYNKSCGGTGNEKGTINPAVIEVKI